MRYIKQSSSRTWFDTVGRNAFRNPAEIVMRSARPIAGEGDAMHDAAMPVIVVDRIVLGRAIVPEGERSRRPAEAASEFRPHLVAEEEIEQRCALRLAHALEADGVGDIDVERLAAGFGMRADDRMLGEKMLARLPARAAADAVLPRSRHVRLG